MSLSGKPTIYNLSLTNANTEYSYALPELITKLQIKCRTANDIKLGWNSGDSSANYITIPAGQTYWDDDIRASLTTYIQSATAGVVAEIQCWSGA